MKKQFTEDQIVKFLKKAEPLPVEVLGRPHPLG